MQVEIKVGKVFHLVIDGRHQACEVVDIRALSGTNYVTVWLCSNHARVQVFVHAPGSNQLLTSTPPEIQMLILGDLTSKGIIVYRPLVDGEA